MMGSLYLQVLLLVTMGIMVSCQDKGSLAFVIDNSYSMHDDIQAIRKDAGTITKALMSSSRIEDMVLVTFSDPNAHLKCVTDSRSNFMAHLNGITFESAGNYDCPEMSLTGLKLALQNSRPGSYIYVFTDASAKDYRKRNDIIRLCHEKDTKIFFVLTGHCNDHKKPTHRVYHVIASACSGEVYEVHKRNIHLVLNTIKDTVNNN